MKETINTLAIDDSLKLKLTAVLNEFDSHRIGSVNTAKKDAKVIKMDTKPKKASFLERLFMTEYA